MVVWHRKVPPLVVGTSCKTERFHLLHLSIERNTQCCSLLRKQKSIVEGTRGIGIVSNDEVFPTIEAHRERNTCFVFCVCCKNGLSRGLEEICYERYRDQRATACS